MCDVRKSGDERHRRQHTVANRVGCDGNLRVRRSGAVEHSARCAFLVELAKIRRLLGRTADHWDRISGRVLPKIRHVPAEFPAAGARYLRELSQRPRTSFELLSLRPVAATLHWATRSRPSVKRSPKFEAQMRIKSLSKATKILFLLPLTFVVIYLAWYFAVMRDDLKYL